MHFDHVFWSRISITWRDHMISIVDLLFDSTSTLFGKYTDVEVLMIMNTRDCKTSGGSLARSLSVDMIYCFDLIFVVAVLLLIFSVPLRLIDTQYIVDLLLSPDFVRL